MNINKPPGLTSYRVVDLIKRTTGVRRVGHGGTLDPFAEGVLVVGIGRSATRLLGGLLKGDKEYLAELALGVVTDTYDLTGRVLERRTAPDLDTVAVENVLSRFKGEILQTPPPFSAVKVGGVRAYRQARRGVVPELKPRRVQISRLDFEGFTPGGFRIRVCCSHGTYIRSLAYDIGATLGCGAHLKRLVRTRVGDFKLEDAVELESFLRKADELRTAD